MATDRDVVTEATMAAFRRVFAHGHSKIIHCINQLDDDQLNWRPFDAQNSVANVILHLCGNIRQWLIAGVEELPDTRRRAAEFSDRNRYTRSELAQRLGDVVRQADQTLSRVTSATITQPRRIQAFDVPVIDAIADCVSHLVGHSHEIVYITRLQLKEKYKFQFVPTKEQGGE